MATEKIISFRTSKWKQFDPEFAQMVKDMHPDIWKLGGNIRGNDQYKKLCPITKRNGVPNSQSEIDALKLREAWNARHYNDFRIAGVIAQVKWLVVGSRGEQYMKNLINEEIEKHSETKHSETKQSISLENHLKHYGKKGMQWGVRTGTSKSSGKKSSKRVTSYKKPAAKLSSKQLADRIKRMEAEKKYQELNKNALSIGRNKTNQHLKSFGRLTTKALATGTVAALAGGVKLAIDKNVVERIMSKASNFKIGGLI